MKLPDFLTMWPGNNIVLSGHRIGLYHVIVAYRQGMDVARIHEEYPSLQPELIRKVLDFYHANEVEVDAYVAAVRAELDQQAARAPRVDWDKRRRGAEQRKRAGGS
jgi:uncharacterized protein (DUF433 family)